MKYNKHVNRLPATLWRRVFGNLTFELSGGEAVRLNEGLGVTDGGEARHGLNATGPAAARYGSLKTASTSTERQRPQTD